MDFNFSDQDNNNSHEREIGIITAVLGSGNSVELPATGFSMFPALRPGDKVVVRPLKENETPLVGSVVVCNGNSMLVMHRLIEIIKQDPGNTLLITRGDSVMKPDEPWMIDQLIGVALSYKRGGSYHEVRKFTPGAWRYKFNQRMLWAYNKLKVVSSK